MSYALVAAAVEELVLHAWLKGTCGTEHGA
jgi:hypothetical protein